MRVAVEIYEQTDRKTHHPHPHTQTHTHTHRYTHTHTWENYSNPCYACMLRVNYIYIYIQLRFKKYLHGLRGTGRRLSFKFRSGTHGLTEKLGRHRCREGKIEFF